MRYKDITGRRSGNLTALKFLKTDELNRAVWLCRCDCGKEIEVVGSRILSGSKKLCSRSCTETKAHIDPGQSYGEWTVVDRETKVDSSGALLVHVLCSCGEGSFVSSIGLRKGKTKKCKSCALRGRHAKAGSLEERLAANVRYMYQRAARQKGRAHELTHRDYVSLIFLSCSYCGQEPMSRKKVGSFEVKYNGLDRVDNSKGYLTNNVVPCCLVCNRAKRDMSQDEWLSWIEGFKTRVREK